LAETGVIGVFLLAFMIILVVASVLKRGESLEEKIRLLGILGLVFMLTLTGSHTVISSIKAVWLFLWLPVIFVLFWPIYRQSSWRATADRGAYDE
jgi:cation transport ATPase